MKSAQFWDNAPRRIPEQNNLRPKIILFLKTASILALSLISYQEASEAFEENIYVTHNEQGEVEPDHGCSWKNGERKVGILCNGSLEFSEVFLTCEGGENILFVESNCGGKKECEVSIASGATVFKAGSGAYIDDPMDIPGVYLKIHAWGGIVRFLAGSKNPKIVVEQVREYPITANKIKNAMGVFSKECIGATNK